MRTIGAFRDLTGQRFGRLIVIEQAGHDDYRKILWRCKYAEERVQSKNTRAPILSEEELEMLEGMESAESVNG